MEQQKEKPKFRHLGLYSVFYLDYQSEKQKVIHLGLHLVGLVVVVIVEGEAKSEALVLPVGETLILS